MYKFFLFLGLSIFSFNMALAETINVKLVGDLIYSPTSFFADDQVRIYATVQNLSDYDVAGKIQFFDNDKILEAVDFILVQGRLAEVWTDWKVSQGDHKINAKIIDLKKSQIGKSLQTVNSNQTGGISDNYSADKDTDGDGIGDIKDLDDDNDGISDKEEKKQGTNPLVFNEKMKENIKEGKEEKEIQENSDKEITETSKALAENIFEKTKEIAGVTAEKTQELIKDSKEFLEEKKEIVDKELAQEKKEEEAQVKNEKIDEGQKNPLVASVVGNLPALKELYSFLLGVIIYILNSPWILSGIILVFFWLFWKFMRNKFSMRERY